MTRKHSELNPLPREARHGSDQAGGIQGEEHLCGTGVPNDLRQITKSPRLAASSNESSTQDILGQDLRPPAGDSGTDDLVSLKAAAAGGDGAAQKLLGEMYLVGRWVERDYQRADEWLGRAASNNVPGAGELLRRGGVFRLRRKKLMLKHLEMAAGLGSPGDLEFLHRAAEENMSEAQQLLDEMDRSGKGVRRDHRQAAKSGHPTANSKSVKKRKRTRKRKRTKNTIRKRPERHPRSEDGPLWPGSTGSADH